MYYISDIKDEEFIIKSTKHKDVFTIRKGNPLYYLSVNEVPIQCAEFYIDLFETFIKNNGILLGYWSRGLTLTDKPVLDVYKCLSSFSLVKDERPLSKYTYLALDWHNPFYYRHGSTVFNTILNDGLNILNGNGTLHVYYENGCFLLKVFLNSNGMMENATMRLVFDEKRLSTFLLKYKVLS